VTLACAVLSACAGAPEPAPSPELTIGMAADVTGIYPAVRDESFTAAVMSNAYEGLTRLDRDMGAVPALAERWENPDDRTWIFTLRRGVRFSDGSALRVDDVVASLRHAIRSPVTRHMFAGLTVVEPVADDRVRVRTQGPTPTLLSLLAQAYVVPASALAGGAPPPSTGPYAVDSWTRGQQLLMRRNTFAREPGPWPALRFLVIPRATERIQAVQEGRVQVADGIPPDVVLSQGRVVSRPGLRVLFLALRTDQPPFSDRRARLAVDLALDRNLVVERALDGHGTPATQLVPPTVFGFNREIPRPVVDPERARGLLRLLPPPGPIRLDGPRNRYVGGERILEEVARQLRAVGLDVAVNATDKETFFESVGAADQRMFLFGWSCDGADAANALGALLHSPTPGGLGVGNAQGYSDPALDALIDQALGARSMKTRGETLARALARVAEERPIVPLVVQHETLAIGPGVDWDPPADMSLRLQDSRPRPGPQ
jgi:peptide/nickel transport system substrate-binding protein